MKFFIFLLSCLVLAQNSDAVKLADLMAAIAQNPTVLDFNTGVQTGDRFSGRITNQGTGNIKFGTGDFDEAFDTLRGFGRFNTGVQTGNGFRGDITNSDTGSIFARGGGFDRRGGDFNTGVQTGDGFSGRIDNRRTGSIFAEPDVDPVELALQKIASGALKHLRRFGGFNTGVQTGNGFRGDIFNSNTGSIKAAFDEPMFPSILGFNTGVQTGDNFSGNIDNRDTGSIFNENRDFDSALSVSSKLEKLKKIAKGLISQAKGTVKKTNSA